MKSTVSQYKIAFLILLFFSVPILSYAQGQININIDLHPIFTKPTSANSAHEFKLGGGPGLNIWLIKDFGKKFSLSGGGVLNLLWFKETGIQVNWGTGKAYYDRKFNILEYGLSGKISYKFGNEKFHFTPLLGSSYTWFNGTEKFKRTKGTVEDLGKENGNFGSSLNLHGGCRLGRKLPKGKWVSLGLEYAHHLGKLETKSPELFGTPSFKLHTLIVDLNILGLFTK